MNLQRYVLAFMAALLATMLYAIHTDAFPKWTLLLGVGAVFLTNLVQATTQAVQIPKTDPASKVSTSVRPPPLPLLALFALFALTLSACSWFMSPQGGQSVAAKQVEDAICVLGAEQAGLPPEASAAFCGVAVEFVNETLTKAHAARFAALAYDGGPPRKPMPTFVDAAAGK